MNSSAWRRSHVLPLLLLIAGGVVSSWPLWRLGFPPQTDDAKCHVAWFAAFFAQFRAGEIYPRWLPNMNAGLGSPAFFYYPPLLSWLTSLLNFVFPANDAWLAVGRSASVALVFSGVTMYAWLQTLAPRRFAVLAALIFLVGPYRATTDIYVRGALAEHWAFVWLPLILMATQNLVSNHGNRVRAWCLLSLLFALLLLTHPPTAVIFAPVVLAFAAFTSSTRSLKNVWLTLAALVFGALLSAIYLVPALSMERLVWMDEMRVGVFSYQNAFLNWENARGGLRLQAISLATLLALATCCFAVVIAVARAAQNRDDYAQIRYRNARFWFAVALLAALMTTPIAAPLYALLPPLQRIQFPYRWLVVVSIAVAPLVAIVWTIWSQRAQSKTSPLQASQSQGDLLRNIEYSKSHLLLKRRLFGTACGCIALIWISLQVVYIRKAYPQFGRDEKLMQYVDWYVKNGAEMPGHRPRDAQTLKTDAPALYQKFGVGSRNYALAEVVRGQGEVRVLARSPRRIELEISQRSAQNQNAQNTTVRVRQFNFGAWRAIADNQVLRVSSSLSDGLVLIDVPAIAKRVTLEMPPTSSEIWGRNLSFSALIMWMILLSSTWIFGRKARHRVLDVNNSA